MGKWMDVGAKVYLLYSTKVFIKVEIYYKVFLSNLLIQPWLFMTFCHFSDQSTSRCTKTRHLQRPNIT